MKLLVTGGTGYIGSVVAHQLVDVGHQVEIIDNLSTGFGSNLPTVARFHGELTSRCAYAEASAFSCGSGCLKWSRE